MRALNIKDPFAGLTADGRKGIDWRTWSTTYRGPVVIVTSQTVASYGYDELARRGEEPPAPSVRGATLCVRELLTVRDWADGDQDLAYCNPGPGYSWVWGPKIQLLDPVRVRGHETLWNIDDALVRPVRRARVVVPERVVAAAKRPELPQVHPFWRDIEDQGRPDVLRRLPLRPPSRRG